MSGRCGEITLNFDLNLSEGNLPVMWLLDCSLFGDSRFCFCSSLLVLVSLASGIILLD